MAGNVLPRPVETQGVTQSGASESEVSGFSDNRPRGHSKENAVADKQTERIIRNRLAEAAADIKDAKDLEGQERHDTILRALRSLSQAIDAAITEEGVVGVSATVSI